MLSRSLATVVSVIALFFAHGARADGSFRVALDPKESRVISVFQMTQTSSQLLANRMGRSAGPDRFRHWDLGVFALLYRVLDPCPPGKSCNRWSLVWVPDSPPETGAVHPVVELPVSEDMLLGWVNGDLQQVLRFQVPDYLSTRIRTLEWHHVPRDPNRASLHMTLVGENEPILLGLEKMANADRPVFRGNELPEVLFPSRVTDLGRVLNFAPLPGLEQIEEANNFVLQIEGLADQTSGIVIRRATEMVQQRHQRNPNDLPNFTAYFFSRAKGESRFTFVGPFDVSSMVPMSKGPVGHVAGSNLFLLRGGALAMKVSGYDLPMALRDSAIIRNPNSQRMGIGFAKALKLGSYKLSASFLEGGREYRLVSRGFPAPPESVALLNDEILVQLAGFIGSSAHNQRSVAEPFFAMISGLISKIGLDCAKPLSPVNP